MCGVCRTGVPHVWNVHDVCNTCMVLWYGGNVCGWYVWYGGNMCMVCVVRWQDVCGMSMVVVVCVICV